MAGARLSQCLRGTAKLPTAREAASNAGDAASVHARLQSFPQRWLRQLASGEHPVYLNIMQKKIEG